MLNLDMFARLSQPSIENLPIIEGNEKDEDDSESSSTSGDNEHGESTSTGHVASSTSDAMSSTNRSENTATIHRSLAMIESQTICWQRGYLFIALALAMASLTVIVHKITILGEYERFETQFEEHASKIITAFQTNVQHGIGEVDNFALSITSYSHTSNISWPFAILPEFQIRAASTRRLANADLIALVPSVPANMRQSWEVFTQRARDWDDYNSKNGENETTETNSRRLLEQQHQQQQQQHQQQQQSDEEYINQEMELSLEDFFANYGATNGTISNFTDGIADKLYRMDGIHKIVDTHSGPYNPIWQTSPLLHSLINYNLITDQEFGDEAQLALDSQQGILGRISNIARSEGDPFQTLVHKRTSTTNDKPKMIHPFGVMFYPVLDSFQDDQKVVGLLITMFRWARYLYATNLPPEADGIYIILRNDCDQQVSFQIQYDDDKSDILYLGEGDLHDQEFDRFEVSVDVDVIVKNDGQDYVVVDDDDDDDDDARGANLLAYSHVSISKDYCRYSLHVYPSETVRASYITRRPAIFTIVVIAVFVATGIIFLSYDSHMEERQHRLVDRAVKSHQIVTSLFPEVVRDRLFGDHESPRGNVGDESPDKKDQITRSSPSRPLEPLMTEKNRLKSFLHTGYMTKHEEENSGLHPIADLFTDCTVLFADIAGFTAWSSVREPSQVFTLLEAIYAAFDKIAAKRRVFKVETIGDCYVAVTGLPDPQQNHATIMVRFARDCLEKIKSVTRKLEVNLGPETGDLSMRFGLHSGPVTAGVLRGQKSRFQLFGDTVNTAARMESTGKSNMIQCSQATANILSDCGKAAWLTPRKETVEAKGKGVMKTYWVTRTCVSSSARSGSHQSTDSSDTSSRNFSSTPQITKMESFGLSTASSTHSTSYRHSRNGAARLTPHEQRLVGWTVELLGTLLKAIIASRKNNVTDRPSDNSTFVSNTQARRRISTKANFDGFDDDMVGSACPRDEYAEVIIMPKFDPIKAANTIRNTKNHSQNEKEPSSSNIALDPEVDDQLRDYVTTIACSYHQSNKFHNFEHACHVVMAANKILKRVVAADDYCNAATPNSMTSVDALASNLHSFTYGITSDPLTHFACIFAALVHDVDHPGVSNMQLKKENDEMSEMYAGKSIAEQNSIDVAWDLLMDPRYEDLRKCIYVSEEEFRHFRNLLVNSVMATDIFDPDLVAMRNQRWQKAFAPPASDSSDTTAATSTTDATTTSGDESPPGDQESNISDLRATIVIEHIIQASDVAHTMQHWHVYQKWNERLFQEMTLAYNAGRLDKNPADGWYKGELWFYDNYIIPLAKKLKNCGVFGVASDEFLTYARDNRSAWESKGREIIEQLVDKIERGERTNCAENA